MSHQLMQQSPRVSTKAPRVGYRTVHLALNCVCLATAALETYIFYWGSMNASYSNIINPGKSIRIAYLVIVTGLAIASAVVHGIGNASRPNKSPAIKRVHEVIYYSLSGGSLVMLSIVLLIRFVQEMQSNGYYTPFSLAIIVLSFTDAMVYLAAAASAWLSRSEY